MLNWLRRRSYRGLRLLTAFQYRLRRRFTPVGRILLGGLLAAAILGIDTRQNLAHQAFGLLTVLLALAWLASIRVPGPFRVQRHLPRYATVDEPCHYRLRLENTGRGDYRDLQLQEVLPDPRPDLDTFLSTRVPGEETVNPVDRLFGYPRWYWLTEQGNRVYTTEETLLPALPPLESREIGLQLVPRRRGYLHLQGLRVSRSEPLGLCRAVRTLPQQHHLLVLPRRYPVPPQYPPGRRRLQPGGLSQASAVGEAQEFIGLRDYRPGDPLRHIHWPSWARTGRPVVKEFQDEYFSRQALILDSFAAPLREQDFEAAVSVAASFVEPLQGPDSLLDLMFVSDEVYCFTSGRGLMSSQGLLENLACVGLQPDGDFSILSRAVLEHATQLSSCLLVLLDWDEQRQTFVRRLRSLAVPLRVVVIGSAMDLDPGPMGDQPRQLHRLQADRLAEGLMELGT